MGRSLGPLCGPNKERRPISGIAVKRKKKKLKNRPAKIGVLLLLFCSHGDREKLEKSSQSFTRRNITSTMSSSSSSSSSGLTFKLHPLVILNISDHHTRVKSQMHSPNSSSAPTDPPPRVYGCVIGVQSGRTVEIFNSFELLYDPSTQSLDRAFLVKKQELCTDLNSED